MGMLVREGKPLPYEFGVFVGNSGVACTNNFAPREPVAHKLSNFLKPVRAGSTLPSCTKSFPLNKTTVIQMVTVALPTVICT